MFSEHERTRARLLAEVRQLRAERDVMRHQLHDLRVQLERERLNARWARAVIDSYRRRLGEDSDPPEPTGQAPFPGAF